MPSECKYGYRNSPERDTEYDHRTRLNMTTELTEWSTEWHHERLPRDDHRDLTATDITHQGLHMEIKRADYRELYRTKPLTEMLTEWRTEGSRNYRRTAYRTECETTVPKAYQITTEKPTNILSKLPTEMATEKSTKNAPNLPSE
jgi:hypothetical protein